VQLLMAGAKALALEHGPAVAVHDRVVGGTMSCRTAADM
jgi:hypothetical protein